MSYSQWGGLYQLDQGLHLQLVRCAVESEYPLDPRILVSWAQEL